MTANTQDCPQSQPEQAPCARCQCQGCQKGAVCLRIAPYPLVAIPDWQRHAIPAVAMVEKMKISCNLTISRNSNDVITLRVRDGLSRNVVLEAEIQLKEFAQLLTGLSEVDAMADWHNTEFIGKTKIIESRSIVCPLDGYDRKELSKWLKENSAEEGWFVDAYLGSQSSIGRRNGKVLLNYRVFKYVDSPAIPPVELEKEM